MLITMNPTTTRRESWGVSHPHKPCALAHHKPGSSVTFTVGLRKFKGVVAKHDDERRSITVITHGHPQEIWMSCGGVARG